MPTQSLPEASGTSWAWALWLALAITLLLQLPTFWASHSEGDEIVYVVLSQQMGWDLSNYTVRDVAPVNQFPERAYRSPLYTHPPLIPLLIKGVLQLCRMASYQPHDLWPVMLIGLGFKLLALFSLHALLRRWAESAFVAPLGVLLCALCPVLSFASARILLDAALAALLLWSVVALQAAIERNRLCDWAVAGVAFSLFLNTKYQALGFLPIPLLVFGYARYSQPSPAFLYERIRGLSLFAGLCLLIGLSHYFRMWLVYGTASVEHLLVRERAASAFVDRVMARTRPDAWLSLLLLYPLWLAWLSPDFWAQAVAQVRARDAAVLPLAIAVYAFVFASIFTHITERYWSIFTLFLIASFMLYLDRARGRRWPLFLFGLSCVLMGWSSFLNNAVDAGDKTALVRPAATLLAPAIADLYR